MSAPRTDVVAAWISWLRADGFNAASIIPPEQQHSDGMVRVSRVGGGRKNIVMDEPRMLFEVWHHDDYEAAQLAQRIAARVEVGDGTVIAPHAKVTRAQVIGPVALPDPQSSLKRYQVTATCLVRHLT